MLILQSINMSALVPSFELNVGKTTVGRDPRCQITLDNSFISRRHAEIIVEEDGSAYVRDLGSSNGTYINSAVLDPEDTFVLEDGDILSFGVDTFFDEVTGRLFKVIFVNGEETNEQTNSNQNRMNEDGSHMNGENEDTTVRQCYVVLQRLNLNNANDAADDDDNRMVESTIDDDDDDDDNARCNGGNHCTNEEEEESRKRRRSQEDIDVTSSKKLRNDEEEKMDYTMDEVIFCNDDESDEFPCSQIFDHVQEACIHESDNEKESDHEVIEIDDEDDEFDETERHWINRLSQTFDSPKEVKIPVFKENIGEDIEIIEIEDEDEEFDYNERHLINRLSQTFDSPKKVKIAVPEENICGEVDSCNENVCKSITPTEEEEKVKIADPEENISEEVESIKPTKEEREENEENLDNSLKPKRHVVTRRQIKLVEAKPLTTNRRTRSKKSKTRSNLTKLNASPLKTKLTNSQKTFRKNKLKSIASLEKSDEATPTVASEAPAKDPSPRKSKSRAKVTRKNRTDLLLDSLVDSKPSASKIFKIPKLRKSRSNKNETPSNEENVVDTCKQNVDENCKENDEMPTSASSIEIPLATPATANSLPQCTVISKRKSVSFNEQIHFKEIESLPGTRKYEVSKLGHKAIRKVDQEFPIKITFYKPPCKLDEIFSYILRWSVTWLEEEKKNGAVGNQRTPPPVGFEIPIKRLPHEFESFFEYYKCVLPLALLETWAKISNDYFNKSNQNYLVKVDSFRKDKLEISMLPNSTACRQQLVIDCHTYMHERDMREGLLRIGDLGIAELRFNVNGQNKHIYVNVFCYVQNVSSSKVSDSSYIGDSDLLQKLGLKFNTNLHRVHVGLLVKCRSEEESLITNGIVRLKIVSYIRPTLKHFVSLLKLETSPLMPAILKPSTFDFSVEEFKIHKFHGKLNSAQERAVAHATKLCMGSKPNIGLIHGPPGTGKSHVIINLIQTLISESIHKFNKHPRILLCAPTNAAIDHLVLKLKDIRSKLPEKHRFKLIRTGQVDRKSEVYQLTPQCLAETQLRNAANLDSEEQELEVRILQAQRTSYMCNIDKKRSDSLQRKIDAIDEELRKLLLNERQQVTRHQQRELETSIIRKAQIIATTLSSCNNEQFVNALTDNGREHPSITCCIIDEAAQCNETELLLPLALYVSKMILVGDPLQLTATTFSQVSRDMKYGKSLFSRIYKVWENNEGVTSTSPINFLDTQYRMHPSIASWPSRHIYKGRLKNNNLFQKNSELNPYMLINHNFQQSRERETNYREAQLVVSLAFSILKKPSSEENMRIGIITPYANQRKMMQSEIRQRSVSEGDYGSRLEVNSIDGFQGQERDVIIVSMVRSEGIGFMNEIERINVMLTRAEKCLLVCANFNAFLSNHIWKDLYEDGSRRKKVFVINDYDDKKLHELLETIYAKQRRRNE